MDLEKQENVYQYFCCVDHLDIISSIFALIEIDKISVFRYTYCDKLLIQSSDWKNF